MHPYYFATMTDNYDEYFSTCYSVPQLIESFDYSFQNQIVDNELVANPLETSYFGITKFTSKPLPMSSKPIDIVFTIDRSGSMSDKCSDGRSKMQHIIHTLTNMLEYFKLHDRLLTIYVSIYAFDNKLDTIIEHTLIKPSNFQEFVAKIEELHPRGETNIQLALKNAATKIEHLQENDCAVRYYHIFMTDGLPTAGESSAEILKTFIPKNTYNYFVGFGLDHDSILLKQFTEYVNNSYQFVDKIETSGYVYGEILNEIVNNIITHVKISVTNGLIYDYKKNTWTDSLVVSDIIAKSSKTFHLLATDPQQFKIKLEGCYNDEHSFICGVKNDTDQSEELVKYVFRQRTLQYLYLAQSINRRDNEFANLKHSLKNYLTELKSYMETNHLQDDKFMKKLCDDIYVCIKSLGTRYANMYCTSRQVSQGTQRAYTTGDVNDIDDDDNIFNRPTQCIIWGNRNNNLHAVDDEDDLQHVVSDVLDSPYVTPQVATLMRFVSGTQPNTNDTNNDTDVL